MVNKRDVSPMPSPPSEHLYLEMMDSPSPPRPPTRRCQVSKLRVSKKNDIIKQKKKRVREVLGVVFRAALDAKIEGH